MNLTTILLVALIILVLINIIICVRKNATFDIGPRLDSTDSYIEQLMIKVIKTGKKTLSNEMQMNRQETNATSKENREELMSSLNTFSQSSSKEFRSLADRLKEDFILMGKQQNDFNSTVTKENKVNREELGNSLSSFEAKFDEKTKDLNHIIRQNFADFSTQHKESNKQSIEGVREFKDIVEKQLVTIREDNSKQLDEMRKTVDEKLQKTLNERLSQSFETVGKQLQSVQEGLGEMKNLATDVGGLKKVLSNVKMRGSLGEVQLEMLLEQILAPDQYEANVKTNSSSSDLVEFAVKLPGKDNATLQVWLPIDAKFPKDVYENLVDAYEEGEVVKVSEAKKKMDNAIKKMANDISRKYLDPPNTTDFGIMFLPFEGIYAEVVRSATLLEILQRDHKVIVAGPSTLAAILNSLQMGFRTLAIQKRSSEVWTVLGAVKTEFEKFGGLMQKAQKNIETGLGQLEDVMGVRTRAIQRKLKTVESVSVIDPKTIISDTADSLCFDDLDEADSSL